MAQYIYKESGVLLILKEHAEHYQDTKDFLFKDILPKITKRLKSKPNKNGWLKSTVMMAFYQGIATGKSKRQSLLDAQRSDLKIMKRSLK